MEGRRHATETRRGPEGGADAASVLTSRFPRGRLLFFPPGHGRTGGIGILHGRVDPDLDFAGRYCCV
jgi:hypothetical protein